MDIVWVNKEEWEQIKPNLKRLTGVMFLPVAFKDALTNPANVNLLYGTRFSAKTESWCRYKLWQSKQPEFSRVIYARRTQKQAREKTFQLFKDIVNNKQLAWKDEFLIHETSMTVTCKATNNMITGGSFEKAENIMGAANVTEFGVDEPITWELSLIHI